MGTCGTCKHWKRIDQEDWYEQETNDPRYGTCQAIPLQKTEWVEETDRNMVLGDWKAVAVDGSGCFAAIKTRECFGCVLHEPIPVPRLRARLADDTEDRWWTRSPDGIWDSERTRGVATHTSGDRLIVDRDQSSPELLTILDSELAPLPQE